MSATSVCVYGNDGRIEALTQLPVPAEQAYIVWDPATESPPDFHTQYVSGGAVVPRPDPGISIDKTQITADGVDVATISSIPATAVAYLDDEVVSHDGTLEVGSEAPAIMPIRIVPEWPAREWEVMVTAT